MTYNDFSPIDSTVIIPDNVELGDEIIISGRARVKNGNSLSNAELTVTVNNKIHTAFTDSNGNWDLNYTVTDEDEIIATVNFDSNSPTSDLILSLYDEENNFMNPPSDTGWFFYNLSGKSFDYLNELFDRIILNLDPITCEDSYLDLLAKELNIKRNQNWSNDEYRAYIILHTYNMMTTAGLEYVLNQIALSESKIGRASCRERV